MELEFEVSGKPYKVKIEKKGEKYIIDLGNEKLDVEVLHKTSHLLSLSIRGRLHTLYLARQGEERHIFIKGENIILLPPKRREKGKEEKGKLGLIKSPMPGLVTKVLVKEGEEVRENQGLVVMESMKMENTIRSPGPGRVKRVYIEEGSNIGAFSPLVEIEPV